MRVKTEIELLNKVEYKETVQGYKFTITDPCNDDSFECLGYIHNNNLVLEIDRFQKIFKNYSDDEAEYVVYDIINSYYLSGYIDN